MPYSIPVALNAHPRVITLASPVTGQLTVYSQNKLLHSVQANSVIDVTDVKNQINNEFYANGIDGFCTDIRHYVSDVADFVDTEIYLPEPDTALGVYKAPFPAIPLIIQIIILIIAATVAVVIGVSALGNFLRPERPKLWAPNPNTGEIELMDRETAVSALQIANPGMYVNPNTGAVVDPTQPGAQTYIDWYNENLPADWMQTPGTDFGGIITIIVVGVAGVAAIYLGTKFLGPRLSKSGG